MRSGTHGADPEALEMTIAGLEAARRSAGGREMENYTIEEATKVSTLLLADLIRHHVREGNADARAERRADVKRAIRVIFSLVPGALGAGEPAYELAHGLCNVITFNIVNLRPTPVLVGDGGAT